MKGNNTATIVVILLVALLVFTGLVFYRAAQKSNPDGERTDVVVINVKVVRATEMTVREKVSFVGNIEAEETVPVYPKLRDLTIDKVSVHVGDKVGKGQALARLDDNLMSTKLRQARQFVGTAEANLRQADSTYRVNKKNFERYRSLAMSDVVSKQEFDHVENQYRIAEEARNAARFQLEDAKAALANVQINMGYHHVVAPVSGVISERNADPGDKSDSDVPMFVISRQEHLKLSGTVPERTFMILRSGAPATVTVEALPGRSFKATVMRIYPTLDAATRSGRVELGIDSNDVLKPGLYAQGTIEISERTGMVLPREAVHQLRGSPHWRVFVASGDHGVEARTVKLGADLGSTVEILEGVFPKDRIITTPSDRFQEQNVRIEVVEE